MEAVFLREVGVFVGGDVLFQWLGFLSVGLTRARGVRGFEGDPVGANPSVVGHEHQRVPPLGEPFRPRSEGSCGVSGGPAQGGDVGATMETQCPVEDPQTKIRSGTARAEDLGQPAPVKAFPDSDGRS